MGTDLTNVFLGCPAGMARSRRDGVYRGHFRARQVLQGLPLVEMKMINLDLIPLAPFNGLTQLFQTAG